MKFAYKFSNLLGTIYKNGNLLFTPDGNSIISPVGNRITVYDLKNNKARTLSLESRYNYTSIGLSPDGSIMIAANEQGQAELISMVSCTIVHKHKFQTAVQCIVFSPNGEYFAVAMNNVVLIFRSPGEISGEYNPFYLHRAFTGGYDDVTYLDWSSDSRFIAIGCRDNTTRIIALRYLKNFRTYILSGHSDSIVGAYFEENSLHVNTISRNGQLCIWECSLALSDIISHKEWKVRPVIKKKKKSNDGDSESEDDVKDDAEKEKEDLEQLLNEPPVDPNEVKDDDVKKTHPFFYKKLSRHYLANEPRKDDPSAVVSAVHYNRKIKIMVVSFSSGCFYLYELPDVNMIHSLSISDYPISTAQFNCTGDWVALASKELGQLLVWEWQSEQYIMKQQGHSSEMSCISYSPDGQYIATGGGDGKLKIWNTLTGFCYITFSEHSSAISNVQFSRNKKFLVSSSLDGTVRAFDIMRYRNFRTFTTPDPVQFASVAIDYSGELVAAGGHDVFEIYLWSIKLGKLLEVISGHEGPVCSIAFSPIATSSTLVSGSWDKTIKIWNCLESHSDHETVDMHSDVVCVAFSPNGENIAVSTLTGTITVFDIKTTDQVSSIDGRNDMGSGRTDQDVVTAKKNLEGKYFTSIEYSADGECILAGGKSEVICIYHAKEAILLKKFVITMNHSLDGLDEYISRRNLTEFGNMALIEQREALEGGKVAIRLPGVRKGDMAARSYKPEVQVFSVKFSPTGQAFATACTEGLCIYSLDKGVVFDPFNLSLEVTPKSIKDALKENEYSKALLMSLKLNENHMIELVMEKVPFQDIQLICSNLPNQYAERLMHNVARLLQSTPHLQFYLEWSSSLLKSHGNKDGVFHHPSLLSLHESISRKYEALHKICDYNTYTMKVLFNAHEERNLLRNEETNSEIGNGEMYDSDGEDMLLIKPKTDDLEVDMTSEEEEEEEEDDDDDSMDGKNSNR